jgi:hypothetical protein
VLEAATLTTCAEGPSGTNTTDTASAARGGEEEEGPILLPVAITIGAAGSASAPQPTNATTATAATTAGEDEESSSTESRCRRNIPENTSPKLICSREQKRAARDAKKTSGSWGSTALLPPATASGKVGVNTELPSPTDASTSGHEVVVRPCLEEAYFDSGLYATELDAAPVKQWPWEKVAQFVRMLVR